MSLVYLTRRCVFSASHRLASSALSAAENERFFGKCFHPNGHGHNYVTEVTLKGPVDLHGVVMNLAELKQIIEETIMEKLDHKNLNMDVPAFKNLNPTVENIAIVIWQMLSLRLPSSLLYEVKIFETENNMAIYRGELL